MKADQIPSAGVDAYEIFRKIDAGEIRGLLSLCFNPMVSLPDNNFIRRALEKLEFYAVIDFFLSDTARFADIVLPGSLQEEDEGVVTAAEGRVIKINQAIACPGEARQDWRIIQDIAQALGRGHGFNFASPEEIFRELRQASRGGIADYSGITYEKVERQYGVFWPCPHEDHAGTPRLFEPGSWNPIAKGSGRFYFSDGKARFNLARYTPPTTTAQPMEFFIDPRRCIGCQACVQACSECDTHKGQSMIQLDYIDRANSTQTVPVSGRRHQENRRRYRANGAQTALHRLQ